jgi:hypothetical protein
VTQVEIGQSGRVAFPKLVNPLSEESQLQPV